MSEPTCDPVRLGARVPIRASLRCWAGEECGRLLEFGYSGISFPLACGIHVAAAAWVRRTLRACASSRAAAGATLARPARGSSARPRAPGRVGIEKGASRSVFGSHEHVWYLRGHGLIGGTAWGRRHHRRRRAPRSLAGYYQPCSHKREREVRNRRLRNRTTLAPCMCVDGA